MSAIQSQPLIKSSANSVFKQWIIRHPVIAYFVWAFFVVWILQLPIILSQDGLGVFRFHVPFAISAILFLTSIYLGPTGGALYITSITEGREGVRRFLRRYKEWRVGLRWYLLAFFGFPVIYLLSASIFIGSQTWSVLATHWQVFFTVYLPALLIFPGFITWGEEPGWRGFALTRLQQKYSPLTSALIVGLLHGLWHLPIFLIIQGPSAQGPFNLPRFIINSLGIMVLGIIWAWAFNNSKQSILMAVLLHSSSNATGAFLVTLFPHFPKQAGYVVTMIEVMVAIVLVIATKGRLTYTGSTTENS